MVEARVLIYIYFFLIVKTFTLLKRCSFFGTRVPFVCVVKWPARWVASPHACLLSACECRPTGDVPVWVSSPFASSSSGDTLATCEDRDWKPFFIRKVLKNTLLLFFPRGCHFSKKRCLTVCPVFCCFTFFFNICNIYNTG